MSDLINRRDAIDALEEQLDYLNMLNKDENPTAESNWYGVNWARNTIADLPSADQKHGKWLRKTFGGYSIVQCSVCRSIFLENNGKWNFCPNCGARMDERREE